jgi:hypothetical protein
VNVISSINDALTSFFNSAKLDVRRVAVETYIRRAYNAYRGIDFKFIVEPKCNLQALFTYSEEVSTAIPRTQSFDTLTDAGKREKRDIQTERERERERERYSFVLFLLSSIYLEFVEQKLYSLHKQCIFYMFDTQNDFTTNFFDLVKKIESQESK